MRLPSDEHDRFVVRGKLGASAMGVVYRVWDRQRNAEVALKVLRDASGRDLYRFKREFRALADIVHPNLAGLYELHTDGDLWFVTMELIEGVPFLQWVRPHDAPPPAECAPSVETRVLSSRAEPRERIVAATLDRERLDEALYQLCDGVHALHLLGKLHRDLKPANVLVESGGRVVLLDFGLIQEVEAFHSDVTHEAMVVGTPSYMAPEQAADRPLTDACDWYSVGVMLYEALTGCRPFEGTSREMLRRKQTEAPTPPGAYGDVPAHLERLCLALLHRDPLARPTGDEVLRTLGRTPSAATDSAYAIHVAGPFVGRAAELAALQQALDASRQQRVVQVVRGSPGIGKSALLRHFLSGVDAAEPRPLVLEARCYEREAVPFKAIDPVIDALSVHLVRLPDERAAAILPSGIGALAGLFPVLRRIRANLGPRALPFQSMDPPEQRRRAFGALRVLLGRLAAARPVVVAIDDLQWSDADSTAALGEVFVHPESPPVLLVVCYRVEDEDSSQAIRGLRERAREQGALRELTVPPLTDEDARALVCRHVDDAEAARGIVRDARGSPLFLNELARAAGAPGLALEDVLVGRIRNLPADAQAVLAACAVAARPLRVELALRAAGLASEGRTVAQLRTERLLRVERTGPDAHVEPYHDRVREALVGAMPEEQWRAVHAALARAIEDDPRSDREAVVEHWMSAGEPRRAAAHAVIAAERAQRALAFHRAAALYAIAIEHGEPDAATRRTLLARRGEELAHAGRLDEAAETFAEAARDAPPDERRALKRREFELLIRSGHLERALDESRDLLAASGYPVPRSVRAALATILTQRLLLRLRGLDYRERTAAEVPAADLERLDMAWAILGGMTFVQPVIGRALQMRFLRDALDVGEPRRVVLAYIQELGYRSTIGARASAAVDAIAERTLRLAERLGEPYLIGIVRASVGLAYFMTGRFAVARQWLPESERYLRDECADVRWELDMTQLFYTAALWYCGEVRELIRLVPLYLRDAEERGDVFAERGLRTWRSNAAWLAMGRPDLARAHADAATVPEDTFEQFHVHHYYQLLAHTQIDLYVGDVAGACARVEGAWKALERSHIRRLETVRIESAYLRVRCALALAATRPTGAHLRRAARMVRELQRSPATWGRAFGVASSAQLAALRGDRAAAAAGLRDAIRMFRDAGLGLVAAAAQRRLGEVAGTDDAAAESAAGTAFMQAQAIADPDRMTRLLLPGFPG